MCITVVLADDHALVRESLANYFTVTCDIRVLASVACADDALAATIQFQPNVLLLDINMPGLGAFDAARRMRTLCPNTRVVILSASFHDRHIEQALDAGARGYITKSEPVAQVVKAIRDVAGGALYFSPEVRARLVVDGNGIGIPRPTRTRARALSTRELEVLRHVAGGLPNKQIAANLHLAHRTVDHHIARIMNKLDIHGRVSLAQFTVREGLATP
jgi:DNA-binding NarL/FixJ family response regulator